MRCGDRHSDATPAQEIAAEENGAAHAAPRQETLKVRQRVDRSRHRRGRGLGDGCQGVLDG